MTLYAGHLLLIANPSAGPVAVSIIGDESKEKVLVPAGGVVMNRVPRPDRPLRFRADTSIAVVSLRHGVPTDGGSILAAWTGGDVRGSPLFFPHFATGPRFRTEFAVHSGRLRLFDSAGKLLEIQEQIGSMR